MYEAGHLTKTALPQEKKMEMIENGETASDSDGENGAEQLVLEWSRKRVWVWKN